MTKSPLQRILVVEDEPDIQAVAQLALEAVGGFTVAICGSGNEALAVAPAFAPDLILLDVMMPGIDGPTTLKALRQLSPTAATPVIFMTAKVQPQEVAGYKELGALDVIPKPFDPMMLSKAIGAIWERHHADAPRTAQERFSQLYADYAARLGEKVEQIEVFWKRLATDVWSEEAAHEMYRLIHGLAGSGATFGFAAISERAHDLELLIKELQSAAPTGEQQARIERCIAALQHAYAGTLQRPLGAMRSPPQQDEPTADHQATISPVARRQPSLSPIADSRLIYLVADDDDLAQDLALQIGYFGYRVERHTDLAGMLDAINQAKPIALLLDAALLERAGEHVLAELRHVYDGQPVIFLSQRDDLAARLQTVRAGGHAFLTLPVNIGALVDKLDSLTERQKPEPYRILIVDDEGELAEHYALTLRQAGMIAEVTADPRQVMRALVEFTPDLVLMDMYMPDCNGLELAAVIRQQEAYVSIPIVFLSTEANLDMQLEAMHSGGDDFLTKPIEPGQLISAVSSRVRRSQTLRSLMVRDSLTGLLKHTVIKERLEVEVARAQRQRSRLAFAMIDIDRFKLINDSYGHATGDRVIKSLARLLQQRLRRSDVIGRYGGEEFAIILPDTDGAGAIKVIDELRIGFAHIRQQSNGAPFYTTFSCGIAEYPRCASAAALIDAADQVLYEAKRAGRNRVILADT